MTTQQRETRITFKRDNSVHKAESIVINDSLVNDDVVIFAVKGNISLLYEKTEVEVYILDAVNSDFIRNTYTIDQIEISRQAGTSTITARKINNSQAIIDKLLSGTFLFDQLNVLCNVEKDPTIRLFASIVGVTPPVTVVEQSREVIISTGGIVTDRTTIVNVGAFDAYLRAKISDSSNLLEIYNILNQHGMLLAFNQNQTSFKIVSIADNPEGTKVLDRILLGSTADYFNGLQTETPDIDLIDDTINRFVVYYKSPYNQETLKLPLNHYDDAKQIVEVHNDLPSATVTLLRNVISRFSEIQEVEIPVRFNASIKINDQIQVPEHLFSLGNNFKVISVTHEINRGQGNVTKLTCRRLLDIQGGEELVQAFANRVIPADVTGFNLKKASGGQMLFEWDEPKEDAHPELYVLRVIQVPRDGKEVELNELVIPNGFVRSILLTQLTAEEDYRVFIIAANEFGLSGEEYPTINGNDVGQTISRLLNINQQLNRGGDNIPLSFLAYNLKIVLETTDRSEALISREELDRVQVAESLEFGRYGNFLLQFGDDFDENTWSASILANNLKFEDIHKGDGTLVGGRLFDIYGVEATITVSGSSAGVAATYGILGSANHAKHLIDLYDKYDKASNLIKLRNYANVRKSAQARGFVSQVTRGGTTKKVYIRGASTAAKQFGTIAGLQSSTNLSRIGALQSKASNIALGNKLLQSLTLLRFGKFLGKVPVVGQILSAALLPYEIALFISQFSQENGIFVNVIQNGNGYPITSSQLQYRFRRRPKGTQPSSSNWLGNLVSRETQDDEGGWLISPLVISSRLAEQSRDPVINRGWINADYSKAETVAIQTTGAATQLSINNPKFEDRISADQIFSIKVVQQRALENEIWEIQFAFLSQVKAPDHTTHFPNPGNHWSQSIFSPIININEIVDPES